MTNARSNILQLEEPGVLSEAVAQPTVMDSPCRACPVRHLSICAALSANELKDLESIMSTAEVPSKASLFHEGDPAEYAYSVTTGVVKLYTLLPDGRCQILGFLFPGDFVGLSARSTYGFTAEAVSGATLCRFQRSKFSALLHRYPHLEDRLLARAGDELDAAREQMLMLGRKTAKERLASFLLLVSEKGERSGQSPQRVRLLMSRSDIADFLGLTTETVSRSFTQLRKSGHIAKQESERLDLLDLPGLRAIAQGF